MKRGGHGKTWKFFHKIGHALATAGKDIDHYALGDFFKQAVDGWKEEFHGVGDIFKHIGSAKGWKELGEGFADHLGDAAEVVDPVAGTVANQFAHSLVHGQGFDQALENAGIAMAGGAVGEAGARIGGKLMTKFGESEAGRALKGAIGKVMKRNPEKFEGMTPEQFEGGEGGQDGGELDEEDLDLQRRVNALRNSDREPEMAPGLTRMTPDLLNPEGVDEAPTHSDTLVEPTHEEVMRRGHDFGVPTNPDRPSLYETPPDEIPTPHPRDKVVLPEYKDITPELTVKEIDEYNNLPRAEQEAFWNKMQEYVTNRDMGKVTSPSGFHDEFGELADRQETIPVKKKLGRKLYRKIPTRKALYKGAKREAYNLGKSVYRGIPKTLKEEGGKYLVERALRPLEGEEHFPMTHDGGSTGLGGDKPCPDGMVMVNGQCVPIPS